MSVPSALPPEAGRRLRAGLERLGLSADLHAPLMAYLAELVRWNAAYNLTAVREPAEMVTRHLLDSLATVPVFATYLQTPDARILDIGTGAGLPAVPLALALPQARVTALDSNGKKARFVRHAARALGLANLAVVEARVEHAPRVPGGYDLLTSRAFAALADFLGTSHHLSHPDSRWLALKARPEPGEDDLPDGFQRVAEVPLAVPGLAEARRVIVVRRADAPDAPDTLVEVEAAPASAPQPPP